jgi:WD40 repeat protein
MELVTGGNAQEFLSSRGPFHWKEATSILMDVCRGLAAAHQAGLIHRDIKPANILRSLDGIVKLADFGLVKHASRKGTVVTTLGEVIGTPHYMSPEQSQSAAVDERSDIYALGATLFALLTGQPPYLAGDSMQVLFAHCSLPIPDPREIVADIPEACVAIIRKAMAKNKAHRYAGAVEMLADLEKLNSGTETRANAVSAPTFVWSKVQAGESGNLLSLADVYPGERTEVMAAPMRWRWMLVGLGFLLGFVILAMLMGIVVATRIGPQAEIAKQADWPSLSVAADKAIRTRNASAMKTVIEKINVMQKRPLDDKADQRDAMRQTLALLEKALAFRESITEKGRVLGLDGIVTCVVGSPDDRLIAVGQGSGAAGAVVFDSRTGEKRLTLWPIRDQGMVKVQGLAFTHDSKVLAAACADNSGVRLWHFDQSKESSLPPILGVSQTLSVAFSPVSRTLLVGLEPLGGGRGRPYLKLWDMDTGLETFAFKAEHSAKIRSVAYCAGGQFLASGSQDKRVILWNAETGRIWRELQTGLTVQAIACNPQGGTLAVAGFDETGHVVQFWDYAARKLLAVQPSADGACRCVAFTRDGKLLASGSGPHVQLWNAETQELLATLKGHSQTVTSLVFCAEGGILATGGDDQTMRLWDVTRWMPPRTEP